MISAVNGDLWLDNIGCFRYRVKLNNPLMGTETEYPNSFACLKVNQRVKLNNPLMGTETINFHFSILLQKIKVLN